MDYQQKAEALAALAELSICYREKQWRIGRGEPWYVQQRVAVRDGCCLVWKHGNGQTPQEAIENHWRELVDDLSTDQYLVMNAGNEQRRAVKWNGFMWRAVTANSSWARPGALVSGLASCNRGAAVSSSE